MFRPLVSSVALLALSFSGLCFSGLCFSTSAFAADKLEVHRSASGEYELRSCDAKPCEALATLKLPEGFESAKPKRTDGNLPSGEAWVHLAFTLKTGPSYEVLVLRTSEGWKEVFAKSTGLQNLTEKDATEKSSPERGAGLSFSEAKHGTYAISGNLIADADICGRETLLSPQLLKADGSWTGTKFQRLSPKDRKSAIKLEAVATEDYPRMRSLTPTMATSAAGSIFSITDGDSHSYWAEGRSKEGKGEFLRLAAEPMSASAGIIIEVGEKPLIAPTSFYLASRTKLYHIELAPGTGAGRYLITFPEAENSDCFALVLDSADGASSEDAIVGLTEIGLFQPYDREQAKLFAGKLDEESLPSETKDWLLEKQAWTELIAAFSELGERGKRRVMDLLDDAPCSAATEIWVEARKYEALQLHTDSSMRRCHASVSRAFAEDVAKANLPERATLAVELASSDVKRAVAIIFDSLNATKKASHRSALRSAIFQIVRQAGGSEAISKALMTEDLSPAVALEVLRGLSDRVAEVPGTAAWVGKLGHDQKDFRIRYLLIDVAAHLAKESTAREFLLSELVKPPTPFELAQVARVAPWEPEFELRLKALVESKEVRVRQALAENLKDIENDSSFFVLTKLLKQDSWPLVRAEAAHSLGEHKIQQRVANLLGDALTDESYYVRRAVAYALGASAGTDQLDLLQKVFEKDVDPYTRAAAASSLAARCDRRAADSLEEAAKELLTLPDENGQIIGRAALNALVRLRPSDLDERLKPFYEKSTPGDLRRLIELAKDVPTACEKKL